MFYIELVSGIYDSSRWFNLRKSFTLADISKNGCRICALCSGDIWHPFLEKSAKLKNFLRLSYL